MQIDLFKQLYWDLLLSTNRDQYIAYVIRNIPANLGIAIRQAWYSKRFKRCGKNLKIGEGVTILNPQNIECGDDVYIGGYNYIQAGGEVILESDVLLGPYVRIWTQNHKYDDFEKPVWTQGYKFKPVKLGRDVWVCANVFIMPGAQIGAKSIIAAGSVVLGKEYPGGNIYAGNSARKIGERKQAELENIYLMKTGHHE
jgi:maltose O-acetyltransferase